MILENWNDRFAMSTLVLRLIHCSVFSEVKP